jgi:hypothetical protein
MKKLHVAPYCIALAVGNCFLPLLLGYITHFMGAMYRKGLAGDVWLEASTQFALAIPSWFYIFTALSSLACVGLFVRRVSVSLLVHWLLAVCLLECVALFCFAWGICSSLDPTVLFEKAGL